MARPPKKVTDDAWVKFEAFHLNQGTTQKRIKKLRQMYKTIRRAFPGDLRAVTREEMEAFITRLSKNQFKTRSGKDYSGDSKSDIKKFLRQFYKWLLGDNETYPPCVSWIKVRIGKDEKAKPKDVLTIDQVRQLVAAFKKPEYQVLTLVLFDSGFRISEALSIKKQNLTFEEYEPGKKCFWVECNDSKTVTRKVPLPLFTEELNMFFNTSYYASMKPEEPLFRLQTGAVNKAFREAGERVFKGSKHITPHVFRHSSATYYAKALSGNVMELAMRYGWKPNSKELNTYIRLSGAYHTATVKQVYSNDISTLKEEMKRQQERHDAEMKQMRAALEKVLAVTKTFPRNKK